MPLPRRSVNRIASTCGQAVASPISGRTADAKDTYEKYLIEYPDLHGAAEARIGINRIKFSSRR